MSNPGAVAAANKAAQSHNSAQTGDISETGGYATSLHSAVANAAAQAEADGKPNAFSEFQAAQNGGVELPGIQKYLDMEPGVEIDVDAEMEKTKDERDEEAALRKKDHASFRSLMKGMCIKGKSIAWKRWRVAVWCEGDKFKLFFIILVCINGVLIGVQADYPDWTGLWTVTEFFFLSMFLIELGTKLIGLGYLFFTDAWNTFDFSIVGISVAELVMTVFVGSSNSGLSSFRLLRVFRVVRVIGFVARLNVLVKAFLIAMQSVIWVGVLIIMAVYIFAIMGQGFFKDVRPDRFGTVPRAMATLFQVITQDAWASDITWSIGEKYPAAWGFFVVFVLLGSFGLLNLLTGVFIEALMEITRMNDIDAQAALQRQRRYLITMVASAFKRTDEDAGGSLDQTELPAMLQLCDDFKEMLAFVGLDYTKMQRACKIADYDHTKRSYWEALGPDGEPMVAVHHEEYRPVPEDAQEKGYKRLACGDEGVMEGEIVNCLINMDEPTTKAEYYTIMKRMRLIDSSASDKLESLDWLMSKGFDEVIRLKGGDTDWEPEPMPEPEVDESEEEGDEGAEGAEVLPAVELAESAVSGMIPGGTPPASSDATAADSDQPVAREAAMALFERYDLDGSGTINSPNELTQLVTNMVYTTGTDPMIGKGLNSKIEKMENVDLDFDNFMEWFQNSCRALKDAPGYRAL